MKNLDIDKSQVALRFAQAGQSYHEHAVIQKQIAQQLFGLIEQFCPQQFEKVFEIGCGSGNLSHLLLEDLQIGQLILNDLYREVQQHFSKKTNIVWQIGDIELLEFAENLDLIASSSALQWVVNLDAVIQKAYLQLKPSAYFCFSTFRQQNLQEIKTLTGQGLNYLSIENIKEKLLANGFEVLHISAQIETLNFQHPKQVLQHLKATGVTATASNFRWTKQSLSDFYRAYQQLSKQRFLATDPSEKVAYPLTYHPIYCIARRIP